MAEEIRHSTVQLPQPNYGDSADSGLRELRASARALRERVERLEAQLQQAEELAGKTKVERNQQNHQPYNPSQDFSRLRRSSGIPKND